MSQQKDHQSVEEVRLEKLAQIKQLGDIPYKNQGKKKDIAKVLTDFKKKEGKNLTLSGRLMAIRGHGQAIFADLKDDTAEIQLHIRADNMKHNEFEYFDELIDVGDFVEVTGKLFTTKKGQESLEVTKFKLLSKSLSPLPDKWHGLQDVEKKQRYRYLDMIMNDQLRNRFRLRAKMIKAFRDFLDKKGFLQVETPTLQAATGGALAKPFKTYYEAFDMDVKLRISLEIPLKKLILAGYEKVYEIGRVYRNEGRDPSHLQEFTQLEFYQAYANYENLMKMTEEMMKYMMENTVGRLQTKIGDVKIDLTPPYPRKTIFELIEEYGGIDLSEYELDDLKKYAKKINLEVEGEIDNLGYGKLIDEIYKKIARPKVIGPVFMIDHPLDLSPLARQKDDDPTRVERFQLIINGWEMLNAYSELIDPIDQEERFKVQALAKKKGDAEAHDYDHEYVEAMKYGMPPIAGWGCGIDRMMALLTGIDNVREMVIFPFVKPKEEEESSPMIVEKIDATKTYQTKESINLIEDVQKNEPEELLAVDFNDELLSEINQENVGLTRVEAIQLMEENLTSENLRKHSLAVEAILRAVAKQVGADEEVWGLAGLLHDLDYEKTMKEPTQHCLITDGILEAKGVSPVLRQAVKAHNPHCGGVIKTRLDQAIYAVDPLSGFITACALVQPDKKLSRVTTESMKKKLKDKSFAKGADREAIKTIERLGLDFNQFLDLSLQAMQNVSQELGL